MTHAPARGLEGIGVAVTRPGEGPGRLGELLASAGASVVHWPCIRFETLVENAPLGAAAADPGAYDWLVVTSPRAARAWLDARARAAARASPPGAVRTAAVGPATAGVLREAGWPVAQMAEVHSAVGLLQGFRKAGDLRGARILLPCSDRADDELPAGLLELGARVDRIVAYRTVPHPPEAARVRHAVEHGGVRVVTFTSPSTVEGFLAGRDAAAAAWITERLGAAAIGPTTAEALSAAGWRASTAPVASLEGLVKAARAAIGTTAFSATPDLPVVGGRDASASEPR